MQVSLANSHFYIFFGKFVSDIDGSFIVGLRTPALTLTYARALHVLSQNSAVGTHRLSFMKKIMLIALRNKL